MNSHDVSVARHIVSEEITRHSLRLADPGARFAFQYNVAKFATTSLSDFTYIGAASEIELPADERDCYLLIIPLSSYSVVTTSTGQFRLTPGKAMLFGPCGELRFDNAPGWRNLDVRINQRSLDEWAARDCQLAADRTMHRLNWQLDLATDGARLLRFMRYLLAETGSGNSCLTDSFIARRMETALFSVLLDALPGTSLATQQMREAGPAPRCLLRAEQFILTHVAEPLDLEAIAAAAGVGTRTLQRVFRQYRGRSPMEFLRDSRLNLARRKLCTPGPETGTVTAVALSCGFNHLGKFAASYRERFQESPSDTLRYSRRH